MDPETTRPLARVAAAVIRPPKLEPGARVALVSPAGPVTAAAVERAVDRVRRLGWEPLLGAHAAGRAGYLSGTDAERAADLNRALLSDEVDAVWCLRGGYGTMRLLARIDWGRVRERPRCFIGFSDNTALHLALRRVGIVSFHAPHAGVEEFPPFAEEGMRAVLTQPCAAGVLPFPAAGAARAETVAAGRAVGPLVGGNLSLIAATLGTPFSVRADGAILFLEEVGEPAYRIDRLLTQLRLAGVFDAAAGVALGAFSECPDGGSSGIPDPAEVVRDRLAGLGVPVAMGFPFGHVPSNWTIPVGVRAALDADAGTLEVLEPAVT